MKKTYYIQVNNDFLPENFLDQVNDDRYFMWISKNINDFTEGSKIDKFYKVEIKLTLIDKE